MVSGEVVVTGSSGSRRHRLLHRSGQQALPPSWAIHPPSKLRNLLDPKTGKRKIPEQSQYVVAIYSVFVCVMNAL